MKKLMMTFLLMPLALAAAPVRVIFDTDMFTDYDDVGALAILHAMADAGECDLIAVGCNTSGDGNRSVAACEVINAYYGRADIPVGCARRGGKSGPGGRGHGLMANYAEWARHIVSTDAPEAVEIYRRALAEAPDKSVVLCSVGFLNNVADLLAADRALVARKVRLWVCMGCKYPSGREYNTMTDPAASAAAFGNWPASVPIVWTDFDYGVQCFTGRAVAELPGEGNPVRDAFRRNLLPRGKVVAPGDAQGRKPTWDQLAGHPSWDETAALIAVRGWETYFNLQRGTHRMTGGAGDNAWTDDAKSIHGRVTDRLPKAEVGRVIDELMCRPPKNPWGGKRLVRDFNDGWSFSRDRKSWKPVSVPHDWAIGGPFDPNGNPDTGKLPWKGVGWYRKTLVLERQPVGRRLFLDFDGVQCDGTVFVNGQPCAHQVYGYLGMRADATPYLGAGTNTVEVRADTTKLSSRWYPGAGLYRRVRRIETDEIYLDDRDVRVETPEVSAERARVTVRGLVTSRRAGTADAAVTVTLRDPDGAVVATARARADVPGFGTGAFSAELAVASPKLWKMECPAALYTTEIAVAAADGARDTLTVRTGLRSFRFDADRGFFLNGERVQLNGVDLHSDLGIVGMAFNKSVARRQLGVMRDMGANAFRTSHNPPAPEMLDLCDEMGIFVWDECFDKWQGTCGRGDEPLEAFVAAKLAEFVRRDRNHASVFVWSIGNEIPSGGGYAPGQEVWNMPTALGTTRERCARFRRAVRAEDATRPVGIGSCFRKAVANRDYADLDITGWNYDAKYDAMKAAYPDKPVLYSESASAFSDYGYYAPAMPTNKRDYAEEDLSIDSYDRNSAAWSDIPDREFEYMERDRFCGGEFVWTGTDYLGEPSPYANGNQLRRRKNLAGADRARSSYFGICDLLALPKDRFYLYRSHWNRKAFTLHIVPDHWTFPERAGKTTPVYVYTSADEAELFVNGVSQGRRRKDPKASMASGYYGGLPRYRLMWNDVVWAPGEVKAVAYGTDGRPCGEETVRTAGAAARVVLASESATLPADADAFVFVKVTLADANGTPVPRDNRRVSFKVRGPAEIVAVGNSDPRGHVSFKETGGHPLCNGRAGLFIRRTGMGSVTLTAAAEGLSTDESIDL